MAEMPQKRLSRAERRAIDEAITDYRMGSIDLGDLTLVVSEIVGADAAQRVIDARLAR